ncbi:MAG: LptF/LptG family permease, partial [Tannerellaceae bacterium]
NFSYRKSFSDRLENKPIESVAGSEASGDQRAQAAPIRPRQMPPPQQVLNYDSLFQAESASSKASLLARAKSSIENVRSDYYFKAATVGDEAGRVRRHLTEWHKKFTLSFACLVFFFIGAPLGAIIRKGGLGMPVVISVILFIFYEIIDNIGFKMARDGMWEAWQGMWLSSAILTPLGVFLTYKAVNDSVILNADTYLNALKNLIGKRSGRKIEKKEMIIFAPDYVALAPRLNRLAADCGDYLTVQKRWQNYISFWRNGGKDPIAERIANEMEAIIIELNNSDQNLLLNKLMDYPVIGGYSQLTAGLNKKSGLILGLIFPLGLPVYFLSTYQRKLLRHDVRVIQKVSNELHDIITGY